MCATCRISGFSLSRSSVCDCRRTLTPPSGGRPPHTHAPTDRVFHSRGHFESDFFADSAALSKLGWVLASGIVGILLALYLWANLPITAVWLLGVLLGIQLICEGAALGYLAWKVRTS